MKRNLLYVMAFFAIFIIPNNVKAALCDNRNIADYRELISNVSAYSNYRIENGKALFDVTITNLPYNVYMEDAITGKTYSYKDMTTDNELIITGYEEDQRLVYRFYMSLPGCHGQYLGATYVTLPNYNQYSEDPVCVGAEEYSLCQKWGVISSSYEDFVIKVNKYKENKNNQQQIVEVEETKSLKDKIIEFIGNYYIYMVSGIVIIILLLSAIKTIAVEKSQFNFRV